VWRKGALAGLTEADAALAGLALIPGPSPSAPDWGDALRAKSLVRRWEKGVQGSRAKRSRHRLVARREDVLLINFEISKFRNNLVEYNKRLIDPHMYETFRFFEATIFQPLALVDALEVGVEYGEGAKQ
jgi:hypothetical protein